MICVMMYCCFMVIVYVFIYNYIYQCFQIYFEIYIFNLLYMYMFMFVICLYEIKVNNFDNFVNVFEQLNILIIFEKF